MKCNIFEEWLRSTASLRFEGLLPDELQRHIESCETCRAASEEARILGDLMGEVKEPGQSDEFWNDYLAQVMDRTRNEEPARGITAVYTWTKRLIGPAAAFALIAIVLLQYNPFSSGNDAVEEMYTTTLDFVLEEHDMIVAQNIFDPTPVYTIEEFLFEEPPLIRNND